MKKLLLAFLTLLSVQLSAQTWTQLGNPPANYEARNHVMAFSIDGFGYLATGAGNFYNSDVYKYDPSNDSWTQLANFPGGPRSFGYAVENNGKAYAGFGLLERPASVGDSVFSDLWEFDPVSNSWTALATFPGQARWHPAMVATPGKIFVGCGGSFIGDLKDWWEYDINSDVWTKKADLPSFARHHPYFFEINGEAYVGFGHQGNRIYKDMYRYNPTSETWTAMANLPAQGRVAGTQFSYGGKGYLLSGQGEDHRNMASGEFWEYDPVANSWTSLPPHPGTSRWAPGSFVIGNTVYFTSGSGFGNSMIDISDLWKYDLPPFAVGVEDVQKANFEIFPNPAINELTISIDDKIGAITVFSILGVPTELSIDKTSENSAKIDVTSLSAGNYILQISQANGTKLKQKFTKQ
jgi:N-acetylneuraminic acid mutarotase